MATEIFYDTFTRADGAPGTSTSGRVYTVTGATPPVISNNALTWPSGGIGFVSTDLGSADQIVVLVIGAQSTSNTPNIRLQANTALTSYTGIDFQPNSGGMSFYKDSGFLSPTGGGNLGNAVVGDEVAVYVKGNRIEVWINGYFRAHYQGGAAGAGTFCGVGATSTITGFKATRLQGFALSGSLPIIASTKAQKMGYDRDGTLVRGYNATNIGVLTQAQRESLNNSKDSDSVTFSNSGNQHGFALIFPEVRHVAALFQDIDWGSRGSYTADWSPDSTDGSNGNWTTYSSPPLGRTTVTTPVVSTSTWGYRQANLLPGLSSVRALRFTTGYGYDMTAFTAHVYGWIPSGAGVHRVQFWHPYLDIQLPSWYFDLDDVGQGTTKTRSFRLKNISQSLTANSVVVDLESLDVGTTMTDQWGVRLPSTAASTYPPNVTVTSLTPGEISPIFTTRRITPGNQAVGVAETLRVRTSVASFS